MTCNKCLYEKLMKNKEKAMKDYTEKLKKENYEYKNNGLSDNKPKK